MSCPANLVARARMLRQSSATANNGRRKELQQHFVLHLKVIGTLSNGTRTVLTEATTSPIVVRGRSPRNFQARKEIPLVGSSAGSRGQALVETGIGILAGPLTAKPHAARARGLSMSMPRGDFTFTSGGPRMPSTDMGAMRAHSYSNWPASNQMPGGSNYPPSSMPGDAYPKGHTTTHNYGSEPQEVSLQASVPAVPLAMSSVQQPAARTSYAYPQSTHAPPPPLPMPTSSEASLGVSKYIEDGRPTKSPRHGSHPSIQSVGSVVNDGASEYRYGSSYGPMGSHSAEGQPASYGQEPAATLPPPQRDFYGSSSSWTTGAGEAASTAAYAGPGRRAYPAADQYKTGAPGKSDNVIPPPGSGAVYTGPPRESIDTMNHYSWHAI